MKTAENYILGLDGQQRAIVSYLHQFISNRYDLNCKIQWKIPTYHNKSLICYLNPIKNNGVELAFFRGSKLSNAQGVLSKKGRKLVAGIDIFTLESIDDQLLNELLNEALILDDLTSR